MSSPSWKLGDWVVYRKQKSSDSPGPRATHVHPAASGDDYSYLVEKYWIIEEILDDGRLQLRTRRGKQHIVTPDDPRLRPAHWWERWLKAARFQAVESSG